jgi:hypothetical protein
MMRAKSVIFIICILLTSFPSAQTLIQETFVPKTIETDALVVVLREFQPMTIDTDTLSVALRVFQPITMDTETLSIALRVFHPLTIVTDVLSVALRVFQPMTIDADALSVALRVFNPITITTESLSVALKVDQSAPTNDSSVSKIPAITGMSPNPLRLAPGESKIVDIQGKNLENISGFQVMRSGQPSQFIKASFVMPWPTSGKVKIEADKNVQVGTSYRLRIIIDQNRRKFVNVTPQIFSIVIKRN